MRTWMVKPRILSVVACLVLVSALGGMPPREEADRRTPPTPMGPQTSRAAESAPSARRDGPTMGPRSRGFQGRRPNREFRTASVQIYTSTGTVIPPPWRRRTAIPDQGYWQHRDLMAEIQWLSRSGFIPVSPIGDRVEVLSDYSQQPAGWRAYGVSVPAGGTVQVEVQHPKLGWFRLMLVDKWGKPGPGMLQAAIAHQPVMVTYKNPGTEATAIYVIVDDPAWWSDAKYPYTLVVRRDWDTATIDLSQVKMVSGLWGATPSVSAAYHGPSLSGPAVFPR